MKKLKKLIHIVLGVGVYTALILLVVALLGWSQSLPATWYGEKCDAFREGFRDGWCYDTEYTCFPPVPPICVEGEHHSVASAYHRGYEEGRARKEASSNW